MNKKHRLVPSANGKIKEILLASSGTFDRAEIEKVFRPKYKKFDKDVKVVVCTRVEQGQIDPRCKDGAEELNQLFGELTVEFKAMWYEYQMERWKAKVGDEPPEENDFPKKPEPEDAPDLIWVPVMFDYCKAFDPLVEKVIGKLRQSGTLIPEQVLCDPEWFRFSKWTQDPFLILEGGDGDPVFVEPWYFPRFGDRFIAENVAEWMGYFVQPTRFNFQGGDVLVGRDELLIGVNTLRENWDEDCSGMSLRDYTKYLSAFVRKNLNVSKVSWIGHTDPIPDISAQFGPKELYQPFFHLDLFVAMGGIQENGEKVAFVADLVDCGIMWHKDFPEKDPALLDPWKASLCQITLQLEALGFTVVQVPSGTLIYQEQGKYKLTPLSFCNMLVEYYEVFAETPRTYEIKNRIYLPTYDYFYNDFDGQYDRYVELEKHAADKIRSRFPNAEVENLERIFDPFSRGALHCVTKVLRRT